ncbi:hypothetical protein [Roseibium sp.]|uniref:hypothetical protein n=1 Tax=Roseibium sp. TaxID=1936156 RepID=UPI003B522CBB
MAARFTALLLRVRTHSYTGVHGENASEEAQFIAMPENLDGMMTSAKIRFFFKKNKQLFAIESQLTEVSGCSLAVSIQVFRSFWLPDSFDV